MMEPVEPEPASSDQATQPKKNRLFLYHATISAVILLLAVILRTQQAVPGCADKLNDGRWLSKEAWQPRHCTLHQFQSSELEECMSQFSNVVGVGVDKWATAASLLCFSPSASTSGKKPQYLSQSNTCSDDGKVVQEYVRLAESTDKGPLLVIHQPLFHFSPVGEGQTQSEALSRCRDQVTLQARAQLRLLAARPRSLVLQLDPNPAWQPEHETGVNATHVYREVYSSAQRNSSRLLYLTSAFEKGFSLWMRSPTPEGSLQPELSLILNTFCAPPSPSSSSCCVSTSHYFTLTILIFVIATYVGVGLILLSGATFALIPHLEAVNFNLDRLISVLHSIGGGAFILLYVLMVDGIRYFQSEERSFLPWMFVVCVVAVAVVAALTSQKTDSSEFLSADQCNEWRGTLILTYIFLHYCNMDHVVAGQLFGELLVGGLVFISGYTHFSHYWKNADFSWRRVGTVLFRLNLLPVLLGLTLGTSYGAYGLPLLLTLGFLFTAAFMASWPQMTPASLQGMSVQGPQHVVVAVKFGFAFLFISFLPWMKGVVEGMASLPLLGSVLATGGGANTLYHWIYSQRYMTLGGMAFGYVMCSVQSNSASTASEGFRRLKVVTTLFSLLIILGYVIFLVSATDFEQSSESQSLIAQPVILSYALLRYFSKPLRRDESGLLAGLGSSSVWLFVSHRHILLSQSGSALLALFPGLPLAVNSALALCVFFFCQQLMGFAQTTLSSYCAPHNIRPSTDQSDSRTPPLTV